MSECPHKKIVARGAGWYCDWCEQQFMPMTRVAAADFMRREDTRVAWWNKQEEEWRAKHE